MSFEPVFETINLSCKKFELLEQIKAECRSEIPSEEVSTVLNVSAWVSAIEHQVMDGALSYVGKIIFYISYVDDKGAFKKCECGSEFKGAIKDERITPDLKAYVFGSVDKSLCDLSGLKLGASCYVGIRAELTGTASCRALSGGESLIINPGEIPVVKTFKAKSTTFPIDEQYELSYPIEEVLNHTAIATVSAVQCGVGAVIVDGQVHVSAIMLQKNDKNDIIKESRSFPFRVEIECEDAMPNMQAVALVNEKSFKMDVSVDENSLKSVVSISVTLVFEGEAFVEENIMVATDVFSTEHEVELIKTEIPFYKNCEVKNVTRLLSLRALTEELPASAIVLAVCGEKAEILNKKCNSENTVVSGVISGNVFFRDGEKNVFTKKVETPFECELDCAFCSETDLTLSVKALFGRARIVSLTEIELECELNFTLYPKEKKELRLLSEVKPLKEKEKNECALSVYIAMEGEELFSLAKRLNVCPTDLAETNSDLQFPLVGNERIVVYRQK